MLCKKYENTVVLYIYDELDAKDRQEFEMHLQQCETCRAALQDMQQTANLMQELSKEETDQAIVRGISEQAKHASESDIIQTIRSKWQDLTIPFKWTWSVAAAAASILLLLSIWNPFADNGYDPALNNLAWNSGIDQRLDRIESRVLELYAEEGDEIVPVSDTDIESRIDLIEDNVHSLSQDIQPMAF